jgi:glucose-1-phosphate cytidylyltransferase
MEGAQIAEDGWVGFFATPGASSTPRSGACVRVVVLAGGYGTRLSEVTDVRPKPMVEIGGRPVLWHILKGYAAAGINHSVVAVGYKGEVIKAFFLDYPQLAAVSLRVEIKSGLVHTSSQDEDWIVDIVDTGEDTNTGGRVKRLADYLPDDTFCLTYGDGVSNVDVRALLDFHRRHGRLATVTAVRPPARFGGLALDGDQVVEFTEKPQIGEGWINGGFMVLQREVIERIDGDASNFEADLLDPLAEEGQLMAFRHEGFWQCMDTLRDVRLLNSLWTQGSPPWRTWA